MKSKTPMTSLVLLIAGIICIGCSPTDSGNKNMEKTGFRLSSLPQARLRLEADTSRSHKDEVNEKICEHWQRDLILGRGTVLCAEPSE